MHFATKAEIGGILLGVALQWVLGMPAQAQSLSEHLSQVFRGTKASAVVLEIRSGTVLAQVGDGRQTTPGSVLKPILLSYALKHGIVQKNTAVYCRRNLHIAGRDLSCTHPPDHPVFDAKSALAESCNTWFASMAHQFTDNDLEAALQQAHLRHTPMTRATVEQRELTVLGLEGVTASPLELAQAYRELLLKEKDDSLVTQGLKESVDYGMANPAAVKGVTILGKTGTASNAGEAWTHGWFAGAIPARFVVVVFVPHGDGGTAAHLAQRFLSVVAREGVAR